MEGYSMTGQEYKQFRDMDIRTVDASDVPDIRDIQVDSSLPERERLLDVARQLNGNPFVYRCGDILVKTSFAGTTPLQAVLEDCLEHSK